MKKSYPLARDGRYSIVPEWTGAPTRMHVARFCGEWIGSAETREGAEKLACDFEAERSKLAVAAVDAFIDKILAERENK